MGLAAGFGLAICVLGILAFSNVVFATVASIYYVGATMLIAGILQMAYAFQVRGAGPFLTWLIIGTGLCAGRHCCLSWTRCWRRRS